MNHPGDRAEALSPPTHQANKQTEIQEQQQLQTKHPQKGGRMLMTDAGTVNILSWISTFVNLILIALIVFLVVMWVKKKESKKIGQI